MVAAVRPPRLELPALDAAIIDALGAEIARLSYVLGTWADEPRKVRADQHLIKIGWSTRGEAGDNVDLSLNDYRRVVLHVIPPETPATDARGQLDGVGARSARPGEAALAAAGEPAPGRPSALDDHTEPASPDAAAEVVKRSLHQVAGIVDHPSRERAARRLELQLGQWTMAASRMRRRARADSQDTAPRRPSSPPWR